MYLTDTIAAISTPHGKGGVALIRISGEKALEIADKVFAPFGSVSLVSAPRTQIYGAFTADDGEFDDGLACYFKAPGSFTGEDVVELCCHGGVYCTQKLLGACLAAGARYAMAGEFTKRAFTNGKLTLTEAEAIGNIIDARTDAGLKISLLQSRGRLSQSLKKIYDDLSLTAASAYAYIDYPTEDLTELTSEQMLQKLHSASDTLSRLCSTHKYGLAISEGVKTAIVGKPNVGKSSILNRLSGEDRAIVTPIAGTTRDVVTASVRVGDVILELSDTAGIHQSDDMIEAIGIQKSIEAISGADLILAVFDAETGITEQDKEMIGYIDSAGMNSRVIAIMNKSDIATAGIKLPYERIISYSALTGEGEASLKDEIYDFVGAHDINGGDIILGARQYAAAKNALNEINEAINALCDGFTTDIALMNIESAMQYLGEMDGREVSQKIVDDIFSHFCVGK